MCVNMTLGGGMLRDSCGPHCPTWEVYSAGVYDIRGHLAISAVKCAVQCLNGQYMYVCVAYSEYADGLYCGYV